MIFEILVLLFNTFEQNYIVGLFAKSKGKSVYQNHHVNSFYVFHFENN